MIATARNSIVPLAGASEVASCGGKAANLARLIRSGAPVPEGLVIVTGAEFDEVDAIEVWGRLGFETVIVRSSAVGEDSADASFAGQLDSVADVDSPAQLCDAVARVWRSQRSERVLAYQAARGISLAGMGIIVQRQVNAALSGVLFTVSPTDPGDMLLEYCGGMGEALVSGAVNPGRVSIRRPAAERLEGPQWTELAAPDEAVPASTLLLNDTRISELLRRARDIERTFSCPQDIEWTIDGGGQLWIVQSRPITKAPADHRACQPASPPSDGPRIAWSNANVNENFPEPISPLLYSIARVGYYHYFRNLGRSFGVSRERLALMEPALRQIIGVHGARMYYNLTSIHSVLRSVPFGDLLAGSFNQFVGAEDTSATRVGPAYRLRQAMEVVVIAAKTAWQYLFVTKRVERFEATVDAYAAATHPNRLREKRLHELLADFRGFMDIRCHRWNDAGLADAGSMVCYGVLQRLLARAFPARDQQALHNSLLKALPDLVSGVPSLKLWDLSRMIRSDRDLRALFAHAPAAVVLDEVRTNPQFARFREAFDDFLERWGYRCSGELMLTVPSFQEEPAPLVDILRAYAEGNGESPRAVLARQEQERIRETCAVQTTLRRRAVSRFLPFIRQSFTVGTILRWTQRAIQLRERARLKQALLYSRLRRVLLEMGTRLVDAGHLTARDDVFFFTAEELELLAAGGFMLPHHVKPLVSLRKSAHAETSAIAPADAFELRAGGYLPLRSPALQGGSTGPESRDRNDGDELHGVGACGGTATGNAAILLDVTESRKLAAGDILVTKQTDPGWGPIFPLISGLVIERGGMLSHGAIIAREFGIPSVVGVKDASRLIPHGARITVDGDHGVVRIARAASVFTRKEEVA